MKNDRYFFLLWMMCIAVSSAHRAHTLDRAWNNGFAVVWFLIGLLFAVASCFKKDDK